MRDDRLNYLNTYLNEENKKNKDKWKTIEDGISSKLFTNSETMEIIDETALSETERRIAVCKFIKMMTVDEIANDVGYDVRTIQRKAKQVSLKLKSTFMKMCICRNIDPKI